MESQAAFTSSTSWCINGSCATAIFQDLYRLHKLSSVLQKSSVALQEISVNASIASDHSGHGSKVFKEIAKQIGLLSVLLNDEIKKMDSHLSIMIKSLLQVIGKLSRKRKLIRCMNFLGPSKNYMHVYNVQETLGLEVDVTLDETHAELVFMKIELERFKQLVNRVWSIEISLRVSATTVHSGDEIFYLSIAEAMKSMATETSVVLDDVAKLNNSVDIRLINRCGCIKGVKNGL